MHHVTDRFYELFVEGVAAGLLAYESAGSRQVFTHTYMYDGFRGQGLVRRLIEAALDDLRQRGQTLTNFCPVVGHFLEQHPEYSEIVDVRQPGSWTRA